LAIYPGTPPEILRKLELRDQPAPALQQAPSPPTAPQAQPAKPLTDVQARMASSLAMQSTDAAEISDLFFRAGPSERVKILHSLADTPLKASPRVPAGRAARAIEALEMAAFVADLENFTRELGETLILPASIAQQIVNDTGGEPLACA